MDKKDAIEVFLGLLGMALVLVASFFSLVSIFPFPPAWIGTWIVLYTLLYHWHRIQKRAQKQGKEVVL